MGGDPKQFRALDGRPVICWAVRAMLETLSGPVIVVLDASDLERGEALLRVHLGAALERLTTTAGGAERADSVRAGLGRVGDASTVLVHDGARPFASPSLFARVGRLAAAGRVVIPALPVHDTLKEIDGDRVVATHDRRRFVLAQTPQGFPTSVLARAHAEGGGVAATDDARLCEALGIPIRWIPGESMNRKLTEPADWAWAEARIESGDVRWG